MEVERRFRDKKANSWRDEKKMDGMKIEKSVSLQ
jgi:hypothetical protein